MDSVLAFHLGEYGPSITVDNDGYLGGAGAGAVDAPASGRISLSMLSVAILGVMFFYIATRGNQY